MSPGLSLAEVAQEARLRRQLDEELTLHGWRSPCEYWTRYVLAWLANVLMLLALLFVSAIYCLGFGEAQTRPMVLAWMISYGWTFAVVEPVHGGHPHVAQDHPLLLRPPPLRLSPISVARPFRGGGAQHDVLFRPRCAIIIHHL